MEEAPLHPPPLEVGDEKPTLLIEIAPVDDADIKQPFEHQTLFQGEREGETQHPVLSHELKIKSNLTLEF